MPVSIRDARNTEADRQWIRRNYAEYLQDLTQLSMNTGVFPVHGEHGDREQELMARWFADDSSLPLILLKNDRPAGFALVSRPLRNQRDVIDYRMAEFFVSPANRRLGVGRDAAQLIFSRFEGTWEITEFLHNKPAVAFWRSIVSQITAGRFRESVAHGEVRQVFSTKKPAPSRG